MTENFTISGGDQSGDGSSPAKAVVVGSVGEEYAWVQSRYPGARIALQTLRFVESTPYDVLTVHSASREVREVYFNIAAFFGKKQPGSPCPYCGEALRTQLAKQCRHCGMDWHDPENIFCRKSTER